MRQRAKVLLAGVGQAKKVGCPESNLIYPDVSAAVANAWTQSGKSAGTSRRESAAGVGNARMSEAGSNAVFSPETSTNFKLTRAQQMLTQRVPVLNMQMQDRAPVPFGRATWLLPVAHREAKGLLEDTNWTNYLDDREYVHFLFQRRREREPWLVLWTLRSATYFRTLRLLVGGTTLGGVLCCWMGCISEHRFAGSMLH